MASCQRYNLAKSCSCRICKSMVERLLRPRGLSDGLVLHGNDAGLPRTGKKTPTSPPLTLAADELHVQGQVQSRG